MTMTEKRRANILADDVGMTIVEIMVSAVIFFIVLTGILGLVGVTTNMGIQAKETTVIANAINSYSERIQAMDFAALITDGSEHALSTETTTVGEYTVTITPTVRPYEANGEEVTSLRYVDVVVSVTSLHGGTVTQSTTITVRDRTEIMSQGVSDPLTDPDIAWGDLMVPEGAVVWDHNWQGGELFIDVDATAKDGRTVEAVNVLVASRMLKNTMVPALEAMWLPHAETFSTDATFIWDTHQTYLDEYDQPVQWIEDGMWTLTAWVTDSEAVRTSVTRHVLIDNVAPPAPGRPTPSPKTATMTSLTWPEVYDGLLPADHYIVQKWRIQTPEEYNPLLGPVRSVRIEDSVSEEPVVQMTTTPFTGYVVRVGAGSPRFEPNSLIPSDWSPLSAWWSSRPLITGSYVVTKPDDWVTTVTLTCTPPNFPNNGAVYRWVRIDLSGKVTALSATTQTVTDTVTAHKFGEAPAYRYRCTVDYLPWYTTTIPLRIVSNTVGPTTADSGTFTEGTW